MLDFVSSSAGPSKHVFFRSNPRTAFALSKSAIASASASAKSLPIPGVWAPWPANMQQSFIFVSLASLAR